MGSVNLYKISTDKYDSFVDNLKEKIHPKSPVIKDRSDADFPVSENKDVHLELLLFTVNEKEEKKVPWEWVLREFKTNEVFNVPNPKSVLLIKKGKNAYAVTFGYSFFLVDKYCDDDFGFDFARKVELDGIKITSLTSPHSKRNKTINSFVDYDNLEFDSGESYSKIKANVKIDSEFKLFKPMLEMGTSIKFSVENESLQKIVNLIDYVEKTIDGKTIYNRIPVLCKVKDEKRLIILEQELRDNIKKDIHVINISELDIIGVTEIFNRNDSGCELRYNRYKKSISNLDYVEIEKFCIENDIDMSENLLDIKVQTLKDERPIRTDTIRNLIDYTNDEQRCFLTKGKWYEYNDNYIEYLHDEIAEIDVVYNFQYDFSSEKHDSFIKIKYAEEKEDAKFKGLNEKEIYEKLKNKYYAERCFNMLRENDGFKNYDREMDAIGGKEKIEAMDLFCEENNTILAVKIGNSSGKLSYVVDQSLTALNAYKHNLNDIKKKIKSIEQVGIWIILDKKDKLPIKNNKHDICQLKMLTLKNKINHWAKEVRLQGYKPIIYLNYKI